jgi:NAD(P)H-dependent flavin oxidoreductase YrpB (nitropropane dioxygenase family)
MNKTDYDNVLVIPKYGKSYLESRKQPILISNFDGYYPIISSPMKWLGNPKFVIEMARNNCLGILQRFDTEGNRKKAILDVATCTKDFGVAIGIENFDKELEIAHYASRLMAKIIVVDIANGY